MKTTYALVAFALLAVPARAQWDPLKENTKITDWYGVEFTLPDKPNEKLLRVYAPDPKKQDAPVGQFSKAYTISFPLYELGEMSTEGQERKSGTQTYVLRKVVLKATGWRVNVNTNETPFRYQVVADADKYPVIAKSTLVHKAELGARTFYDKADASTKVDLMMLPPGYKAPDQTPTAADAATGYEKQAAKAFLTADEAKLCDSDAKACRAKLKPALAAYAAAYKADDKNDFTAQELNYLKNRLGDGDFAKWERARGFAAEKDADKAAFLKRWRERMTSEAEAYASAGQPESYDPTNTAKSVNALLGSERIPADEVEKILMGLFPGDSKKAQGIREIEKSIYAGKPGELKKLIAEKQAAGAVAFLTAEAQGMAMAALDAHNRKQPLPASVKGVDPALMAAAFCGDAPAPQQQSTDDKTSKPMGAKVKDGLDKMAGGDAATLNAGYDNNQGGVAAGGGSPICKAYFDGLKQQPGGNNLGGVGDKDKKNNKKTTEVPSLIGKDTGQTVEKADDPNANRDWLNGAKMGIWAAVIGGIFGGPIGLLAFGAIGMGVGWWMSKEINK